jgi:G3E family GTPase
MFLLTRVINGHESSSVRRNKMNTATAPRSCRPCCPRAFASTASFCVVDADGVFNNPEHEELKIRQIAFSDLLLLNKVDLVGPEGVQRVRDWIAGRI